VEDPVEITQPGLRQVEVKTQIGLTFQVALRSLLRADPDVVMIGEMRDRDAAHTAIEASLTGHLVLSTIHTNNAAETVTRLIEMGEDPFNLADALLGIVAQRLTRKLCPFCKEAYHPTHAEYARLSDFYGEELFREHGCQEYSAAITLMHKRGCEKCGGSGYKGRIAIHELLLCTELVKQTIKNKASVADIQQTAMAEGMRTLRMDGISKVIQGVTDLEQIQRVCL
jgi:type II secretory ATPase GspE/PulE/Tfp pilus assembly ATPase PilB-like protein